MRVEVFAVATVMTCLTVCHHVFICLFYNAFSCSKSAGLIVSLSKLWIGRDVDGSGRGYIWATRAEFSCGGLRITTKDLPSNSRPAGRRLISAPHGYKRRVQTTQPWVLLYTVVVTGVLGLSGASVSWGSFLCPKCTCSYETWLVYFQNTRPHHKKIGKLHIPILLNVLICRSDIAMKWNTQLMRF